MSNELILNTTISKYLFKRENYIKSYKQLEEVSNLNDVLGLLTNERMYRGFCDKETFIDRLDKTLWKEFVEKSPFFDIMPSKKKKEWLAGTEISRFFVSKETKKANQLPEFTEENVYAIWENLYVNKEAMILEKVEDLFKRISWHHKTNKPNRLTKKIILGKTYYGFYGQVDDIEDVLFSVRCLPLPTKEQRFTSLLDRYHPCKAENDMFKAQMFGNGNLHLWFKKEADVLKLNQMLAKKYGNVLGGVK